MVSNLYKMKRSVAITASKEDVAINWNRIAVLVANFFGLKVLTPIRMVTNNHRLRQIR